MYLQKMHLEGNCLQLTHVMYVFVTLTFQDPVQMVEQHKLLALGVITLILGHHLHGIDGTTTIKVTLLKDSSAPSCSNQMGLPASTPLDPEGSTLFSFTYSVTQG